MLIEQLPPAVLALLIAITCAVKHTAVARLVQMQWFQQMFRERRWYVALGVTAAIGALGTFLIFDKFAGCLHAFAFTVVDFLLHCLTGTIAHRMKLYEMDRPVYVMKVSGLRSLHALVYVIFIWLALV